MFLFAESKCKDFNLLNDNNQERVNYFTYYLLFLCPDNTHIREVRLKKKRYAIDQQRKE